MKAKLLVAAFFFHVAFSYSAEPENIPVRFNKTSAFDAISYYAGINRTILVIAPEVFACRAQITLHTNGTKSAMLAAIESAITNQTPVRLETSNTHRTIATAPDLKTTTPPANDSQPGTLSFQNVDAPDALRIFGTMSNATLIITPEAANHSGRIELLTSGSRVAIRDKLAEAITNQTMLKLTRLDKDHIAVTLKGQAIPKKD